MNISHQLSVDQASRLAVTAVAADLEHWACSVAVQGQVDLNDLVGILDAFRAASVPLSAKSTFPVLAAG
jgi:hypothetical protein